MSKRKPKQPLDSFPAFMLRALREGSKKEWVVPCETHGMAVHVRQQIHMLRTAMRDENHPDWKQYYTTELAIEGDKLIIRPKGSKIKALFDAVGLPTEPEEEPPQIEGPSNNISIDDLLKGFRNTE